MKYCIALNREITIPECRKAQRELPAKFCDGCTWFANLYILQKKVFGVKRKDAAWRRSGAKTKFTYKLDVSGRLRELLLRLAAKEKKSVSTLIREVLIEEMNRREADREPWKVKDQKERSVPLIVNSK